MRFPVGFLLMCTLLNPLFSQAQKKHRHAHAHSHGAGQLNLAFDGVQGKVELKAASEGILGFEHSPKTETETNTLNEKIQFFETNIGKMIQMEPSLACSFKKDKIEMVLHGDDSAKGKKKKGQHSDFVVHFTVNCQASPQGSKITFDFSSLKGLKEIDSTVLIDDFQKSFELKKSPYSIEVKK